MRAAICEAYGGPEVVRIADRPDPIPGPGEVRVRVHATAVTSADVRIRSATFPRGFAIPSRLVFGLRKPRRPVLGSAFAGTVDALGPGVTSLAIGDRVAGMRGLTMGAHAEFLCAPVASMLVRIPTSIGMVDAAALPFGATTALAYLDRAQLQPGERVLVNGASGAVGSAAVQIARHLGADVTGVCSAEHAAFVAALGAQRSIDYRAGPVLGDSQTFDVIVDCAGTLPYAQSARALADGGRLLALVASLGELLAAPWQSRGRHRVVAGPAEERAELLARVFSLVESGALKPVVGRRFGLDDIVEAHRYAGSDHKRGVTIVEVLPA